MCRQNDASERGKSNASWQDVNREHFLLLKAESAIKLRLHDASNKSGEQVVCSSYLPRVIVYLPEIRT
jgi:hypothetical protein